MSHEGFLVVSEGEDPVTADIIFVHGLRGSRENTWTKSKVKQKDGAERDIFWPGALLAQERWMKHVRVMSVSSIPFFLCYNCPPVGLTVSVGLRFKDCKDHRLHKSKQHLRPC
jgi:hypothetical protein